MDKQTNTQETGAGLVSRETVAKRFEISIEGVKRLEKAGKLQRVIVGLRSVRYRMDQVLKLEGASK